MTNTTEIQQRILASMVAYPEIIQSLVEVIGEKKVFLPKYQSVYDRLTGMYAVGDFIDLVTVTKKLPDFEKELYTIGPLATSQGNDYYARILVDEYILRTLSEYSQEIIFRAKKQDVDAYDLLDQAQARMFKLSNVLIRKNFASSADVMRSVINRIKSTMQHGMMGVPTGYAALDRILGGMQNQDLCILAGRPSLGKTAMAVEIAIHSAKNEKRPTAIFSAEMSAEQLGMRIISHECKIDSHRINMSKIDDVEWREIQTMAGEVAKWPLFIEDSGGISATELRAKARRLKAEENIGLVIVDYLQLISGGKRDTREQEISHVSRTLKATAKELGIPVLCCSQLSRGIEQRADKKPVLSDLRESGAIEQDADIVIFVHSGRIDGDYRDILVAKHRNGPLGEVRLNFNQALMRFS